MKIGIEYEFIPRDITVQRFIERFPFKNIKKIEGFDDISIGSDTEYYNEIREICFSCDDSQIPNISRMLNSIAGDYTSKDLFIGTHVHFFDEELYNNFNKSHYIDVKIWNTVIDHVAKTSLINNISEMNRMVKSHHLWGQTNTRSNQLIDRLLQKYGLGRTLYPERQRQDKYCIVNKSHSTDTGKPPSVEVRCFPNTMLLHYPEVFQRCIRHIYSKIKKINAGAPPQRADYKKYEKLLGHIRNIKNAQQSSMEPHMLFKVATSSF